MQARSRVAACAHCNSSAALLLRCCPLRSIVLAITQTTVQQPDAVAYWRIAGILVASVITMMFVFMPKVVLIVGTGVITARTRSPVDRPRTR